MKRVALSIVKLAFNVGLKLGFKLGDVGVQRFDGASDVGGRRDACIALQEALVIL